MTVETIKFQQTLNITSVADLYEQLLLGLAESPEVQLDISEVERVDTASLQTIYAFYQEAEKRGYTLTLKAKPEVMESAALLGLEQLMEWGDIKD